MRGRPKKPQNERKSWRISFRLNEAEYLRFETVCKDLNIRKTDVLRRGVEAICRHRMVRTANQKDQ
jgi:hypothetical protein